MSIRVGTRVNHRTNCKGICVAFVMIKMSHKIGSRFLSILINFCYLRIYVDLLKKYLTILFDMRIIIITVILILQVGGIHETKSKPGPENQSITRKRHTEPKCRTREGS